MLAASQDIDNFIERQRSKLNRQTNRQQMNRQRPAPPPTRQYLPPNNMEDRLDFKVARILDEPSPRVQSQQPYFPPSPRVQAQQPYFPPSPSPFTGSSFPDQQTPFVSDREQRRFPNDTRNNNEFAFFDKFGAHEEKRAQLNNDLKREYNEYLRSQQGISKSRATSQVATPRGNTTRRVQFQQTGTVVAPWEKNDGKTPRNIQNMNDTSSSITTEYTTNQSRSRVSRNDEQYIRDREEYILELYDQISELEARKRQLEMGISSIRFQSSINEIFSCRKQ